MSIMCIEDDDEESYSPEEETKIDSPYSPGYYAHPYSGSLNELDEIDEDFTHPPQSLMHIPNNVYGGPNIDQLSKS